MEYSVEFYVGGVQEKACKCFFPHMSWEKISYFLIFSAICVFTVRVRWRGSSYVKKAEARETAVKVERDRHAVDGEEASSIGRYS